MRGTPPGASPKPTAAAAGELFFPQSQSLGLDRSAYSPTLQDKIIYAGVTQPSFALASEALAQLAGQEVSAKQVERVTKQIGLERCAERDEAVSAYQALPLVQRKAVPDGVTPPAVAVVGTDGGRLQILERTSVATDGVGEAAAGAGEAVPTAATATAVVSAPATAAAEAAAPAESQERGRYWREDKISVLMAMSSVASASDPCPEIPESFVDPSRMGKLVRQLGHGVPCTEDAAQEAADPAAAAAALQNPAPPWQPPQVQEKRLLASRQNWEAFGPMVAAAAWAMGLFGAGRRAFLGDGSENNWTLWRSYFSSFVPILDFIHALSYVHAAAHAGRSRVVGWKCYVVWIRWVWQGAVGRVLVALQQRQAELGLPQEGDMDTHPRQVVAHALRYLENNQERMQYAVYRQQGLPITSSYVESAVKQINRRAKGTEKFWSEAGAEAILQLRADQLSDDQPLAAFWERRQADATGQRPYRHAA